MRHEVWQTDRHKGSAQHEGQEAQSDGCEAAVFRLGDEDLVEHISQTNEESARYADGFEDQTFSLVGPAYARPEVNGSCHAGRQTEVSR